MAGLIRRISVEGAFFLLVFLFQIGVFLALVHQPTVAFMWVAVNLYFIILALYLNPFDQTVHPCSDEEQKENERSPRFVDWIPFIDREKRSNRTRPSEEYNVIFQKTKDAYQKGIFTYGLLEDDPIWRRDCRNLFLSNLTGSRVLEVGTGPGLDMERLSKDVNIMGVDLSKQMAMLTKNRCRRTGILNANSLWLPFPSNQFDGLYAQFLLLHIPHSLLLRNFQEWKRVLKKDGLLFFSFVDHDQKAEEIRKNWLRVEGNECPLFFQQPYHIKNFIHRAGFSLLMHTRENPDHYQARSGSHTSVHQFLIRNEDE